MQVCISFLLHRGMVVIPKSVNPKRIAENIKATQLELDAEDVQRLRAIDKDTRLFKVYTIVLLYCAMYCTCSMPKCVRALFSDLEWCQTIKGQWYYNTLGTMLVLRTSS